MTTHERSDGEIIASLTHHVPDEKAQKRIEQLRVAAKILAREINSLVPPGRYKSIAKTKLEECAMWAIKGLVVPPVEANPEAPCP